MRRLEGIRSTPFSSIVWLLPVAATIHNVEEWIWLPMEALPKTLSVPVGAFEFRFALVVVTALYWLVTFQAARARPHDPWVYAALAGAAILSLNVVLPHLLVTMVLRVYAPGVVTALLLNTWIPPLVIAAALRQGYASSAGVLRATLIACAVVPFALAVVFLMAGALARVGSS
ncbi:MAG: HXXEE domain-containing protein [Deltaproteobacteria bacterium]|nr:HXXEE domain-containing protein [Deltaproteobacteria bacterium]